MHHRHAELLDSLTHYCWPAETFYGCWELGMEVLEEDASQQRVSELLFSEDIQLPSSIGLYAFLCAMQC